LNKKLDSEKLIGNEVNRIRNVTQWESNTKKGQISEEIYRSTLFKNIDFVNKINILNNYFTLWY